MRYDPSGWYEVLQDTSLVRKYEKYLERQERRERLGGRSSYKDSDMSRVYRAENKFRKGMDKRSYDTFKEAESVCKRVLKSKLWKDIAGHHVEIEPMKNMGHRARINGLAWHNKIRLAPSGWNLYTILHEFAHAANNAHHGIGFRKTHVKLVSRFVGRDAAKQLKQAYKDEGLKMVTRKKKVMSPEEWHDTYIKMSKLRNKV